MRLGIAGVRSISPGLCLVAIQAGRSLFRRIRVFQFFALISSFSVGFDGFDKSGALIFNNAPSAPLDFQELARAAVWQDSHSLAISKVVLRSEDSAISFVTNKSFRIPIAHPILSLRSFSRISGGLDRGG